MRPLTLVSPEPSRAVLQQEINRHQDARYDHRLHGVLLVAFGLSCGRGAGIFGDSPRTVANWVRRFDQQGFGGAGGGQPFRPPRRLNNSGNRISGNGKRRSSHHEIRIMWSST